MELLFRVMAERPGAAAAPAPAAPADIDEINVAEPAVAAPQPEVAAADQQEQQEQQQQANAALGGAEWREQGQGEAEEANWNPMEWDRPAEELTWERLLGLDGSLLFLEHVFWVMSLNTLFIMVRIGSDFFVL